MTDTLTHAVLDLLNGAGVGRWALDESVSSFTFRHRALWGLVRFQGAFTAVSGDGEILPDGTALGILRVGAASVRTRRKRRDKRLRHLLAVSEHPRIFFVVTNVRLTAAGDVRIDGELDVRDVPDLISFPATITEVGLDAVTLAGSVAMRRRAFGIGRFGRTTVRFVARFTR
jgi:polyisoprenoid-binding protein YceI